MRQLRRAAETDATRASLATRCLDRWHQRGDTRTLDALWVAACWEAAARDRQDPHARASALTYSRAIIAVARGELTAPPPDAAGRLARAA